MIHTESQYLKLHEIICSAKSISPFYRNQFIDYNLSTPSKNEIRNYYESSIKPISKSIITDNYLDCIDQNLLKSNISKSLLQNCIFDINDLSGNHDKTILLAGEQFIIETTTGSTGKPFPIIKSHLHRSVESRYLMKQRKNIYKQAGFDNGFLIVHQTDEYLKSLDYRGDSKKNFPYLLKYYLEKKPKWILTTALLIRKFSQFINESSSTSKLTGVDLEFIESSSQTLTKSDKNAIEKTFNTKLYNHYGARELWTLAYECPYGKMHINNKYAIVDIVDGDGEIINTPGIVGEVVITVLIKDCMPLIKYHLGDMASITPSECYCGNKAPVLCLEPGRKKEKLQNTPYYGSEVFRKVLRRLYFHEQITDIDYIKIVQDEAYHLSIYVEKNAPHDCFFEKRFLEVSGYMIEGFSKFTLDFFYEYPYNKDAVTLKEQIFMSTITED